MMHFDKKDKKILYELDVNSRQSFHDIAKKVGLSKDAVIYRVKKLEEEGIIQHYQTLINLGMLGYTSFRLYLKLQNTTPEKEEEIIRSLKQKQAITWLGSWEGEWDIGMWIPVKTTKEMNDLWKDILNNYRDYIDKRWLTLFSKVTYYPRIHLIGKEQNLEEYPFVLESRSVDIDEKDEHVLKLLAPNARISLLEISRQVKMTPQTITARIKELQKKKVIVGYRTMFDIRKLGYQYYKLHINLHNLNPLKERQLRMFIKTNPFIIYDNEVLGGDDIELDVQVPSADELHALLGEIKRRFAGIIRNYKYMIITKEHKYTFFPESFTKK
jgi:Lrp/AsnC family leucine-responsive transcriptional regulator